jgi:hypothetical protein
LFILPSFFSVAGTASFDGVVVGFGGATAAITAGEGVTIVYEFFNYLNNNNFFSKFFLRFIITFLRFVVRRHAELVHLSIVIIISIFHLLVFFF